jgi:hypothetical protein
MPWSPLNLTGIAGFWRADMGVTQSGGAVTAWADQSPEGTNLTNVYGGNPTYSATSFNLAFPGITIDGGATTEALVSTIGPPVAPSTVMSFFLLLTINSIVSNGRIFAYASNGGTDFLTPSILFYDQGGTYETYSSGNLAAVSLSPPATALLTSVFDGTNNNLYSAAVPSTPVAFSSVVGDPGSYIFIGNDANPSAAFTIAAAGICSDYAMSLGTDVPNLITWSNNTFGTSFAGGSISGPLPGWAESEC